MNDDNVRAYSISEFCRLYGIGPTRAYDLIRDGEIRAYKAGRRTLITRDEAERWLNSLPSTKPTP